MSQSDLTAAMNESPDSSPVDRKTDSTSASYSHVIIIPYRDRESHITQFLEHTLPLFEKHLGAFKVVVIEQNGKRPFNRGKLVNVGFALYENKTTWFIAHDVDMLPKRVCVQSLYTKDAHDVIRIRTPHARSLGCVCMLKHDVAFGSNGHPNNIWGWGIEDRAFFNRVRIMGFTMSPIYKDNPACEFVKLPHTSNRIRQYKGTKLKISNLENEIAQCEDKERQHAHIFSSGLNTLAYTIVKRFELQENVDWVVVDIN